jgi:predicted DNA repair protein MutK
MSGLIALLDDVAALTRIAATSLDDVASMAAKAGTKAAGVIIDDAAVTPKYVTGLDPKRELPIIWKIARASVFNKLVILLPVAMLLKAFAPVLLIPLLMFGGLYLCFEGAEKIYHVLRPHGDTHVEADMDIGDPAKLEETRVKGAIKTDFILSAEIMTITLNEIPDGSIGLQAAALAVVAIAITALVYGVVGLIVKMDDVGAWLALNANTGIGRGIGKSLVRGMPHLLTVLSTMGTAAMLWVGGQILVHGLHNPDFIGWAQPYGFIKDVSQNVAGDAGFGNWAVTAVFDGVIGLAVGLLLIPIVTRVIAPLIGAVTGSKPQH